jgi:acetyltransferase-like isoleucine patch superfamily enzyme
MKKTLMLITILMPWRIRRWVLVKLFGYQIHPSCRIGYSWIFPKMLIMNNYATIGSLTLCKNIDLLHLQSHASIGRGNWITGFPSDSDEYFSHELDRKPQLIIGEHSAITNRHLIDCTASVTVGNFSVFGGFQSQILTHSIDFEKSYQASAPIKIGDYCFIGTNCVILGDTELPNYSILSAKSLLNKKYSEPYQLYGGVPAVPLKKLSEKLLFFSRSA